MMTRSRAAHYLDLSEAAFEKEVLAGNLPQPVKLGSRDHWSRIALDEYAAQIAGDSLPDWRKGSKLYGDLDAA